MILACPSCGHHMGNLFGFATEDEHLRLPNTAAGSERDRVAEWIAQTQPTAKLTPTQAWSEYTAWAGSDISLKSFSRALTDIGYRRLRSNGRKLFDFSQRIS